MKNNKSPGKWQYKHFSGIVKILQGPEFLRLKILHPKKARLDDFYRIAQQIEKKNGSGLHKFIKQSHKFVELIFESKVVFNRQKFIEATRQDLPEGFAINYPPEGAKKQ